MDQMLRVNPKLLGDFERELATRAKCCIKDIKECDKVLLYCNHIAEFFSSGMQVENIRESINYRKESNLAELRGLTVTDKPKKRKKRTVKKKATTKPTAKPTPIKKKKTVKKKTTRSNRNLTNK